MKFRKNLIAGAIAACLAPAAHADIELGSGFSATGFLDMSYTNFDVDGAPGSERSMGIDQFEVDFLFSGSNGVSAQVDIEYGESSADGLGDDETFVEQAFITKAINDKFSVKAGRFLSYSGFEAEEPTGLYQFSGTGYAPFFYGWYQQGVSAYYDGDKVDFMASVINSAFDPLDRDSDPDVELGVAISPTDGFTAKLFLIEEDEDDVANIWASYEVGKMTFAAEYITRDYGSGDDGDGYLLMANYASGNFAFTFRYSAFEIQDAGGASFIDNDTITLAPSFTIGDNLLIVTEYRMDTDNVSNLDSGTIAIEALFSF